MTIWLPNQIFARKVTQPKQRLHYQYLDNKKIEKGQPTLLHPGAGAQKNLL